MVEKLLSAGGVLNLGFVYSLVACEVMINFKRAEGRKKRSNEVFFNTLTNRMPVKITTGKPPTLLTHLLFV
jgi:hypothetical protein